MFVVPHFNFLQKSSLEIGCKIFNQWSEVVQSQAVSTKSEKAPKGIQDALRSNPNMTFRGDLQYLYPF